MSEVNYVYLTIPQDYICIYHKLLILMSNIGREIINDCSATCKGNNKIIIDCWNTFQSAIACKALKKDKEAAETTLDNKYSVMAQQFASYGVMINQMESSFSGLKMLIQQSNSGN